MFPPSDTTGTTSRRPPRGAGYRHDPECSPAPSTGANCGLPARHSVAGSLLPRSWGGLDSGVADGSSRRGGDGATAAVGEGAATGVDMAVAGSVDPPARLPMTKPASPASNRPASDTVMIMRRMGVPFRSGEGGWWSGRPVILTGGDPARRGRRGKGVSEPGTGSRRPPRRVPDERARGCVADRRVASPIPASGHRAGAAGAGLGGSADVP